MAAYAEVKSRAHVLDFEDVLLATIAMLGDRPDIRDQVQDVYRWFTVDEFQDITPAQERLLSLWAGERDDVCVVGDPSQTIYSFAGADPAAFQRFAATWPHTTAIRLDRCYRSTPQIVAVANALNRAGAADRRDGDARPGSSRPGGVDLTPVVLRAQRGPGPPPDVVTCADDLDEAQTVAQRISALAGEGVSLRDMAVLLRTNAASEKIEVALAQAGLAYSMRGAERFFERREVREAVVRLRGRLAAGDAWATPAEPRRPTSPEAAGTGAEPALEAPGARPRGPVAQEVVAVLSGMGWDPEGAPTGGATRERWESLSALVALAEEVESAGEASLAGLVAELERRAALAHAPTVDGVTVATLHSAKGLEWSVVFIVGCAEGGLPIVHADTPERIAEERRLFYVGMTRARDRLVVSWALTRTGSGRQREPSRFLAEMRRLVGGVLSQSATSSGLVRQGRSNGRGNAAVGHPAAAGSVARVCSRRPSGRSAGVAIVREAPTSSSSSGCGHGAWRLPRSAKCPPMWCSPTSRCPAWRSASPGTPPRCWTSQASVRPRWRLYGEALLGLVAQAEAG